MEISDKLHSDNRCFTMPTLCSGNYQHDFSIKFMEYKATAFNASSQANVNNGYISAQQC